MITGDFLRRVATRNPVPLQICLGPAAEEAVARDFAAEAPKGARILSFERGRAPEPGGPAIVVLAPEDLQPPTRAAVRKLVEAARPGRTILYGGTRTREVLLDAINTWRVFRIVPDDTRPSVLIDAIGKAYELLQLDCGLERAAEELEQENRNLEQALRALEETQAKLRHAERLATLGRITSSLIPVIAGHLDALQEFNALVSGGAQRRDPRLDELLGYAFTGIRSLDAMLEEIRGYAESRPEVLRLEVEDVDAIVRFATAFSRFDPLASRREVVADLRAGARIRGDCFRLYQVLINLLRNAFQACPQGGSVVVRTWVDGGEAVIDIENDGEPIPPAILPRLFQPFFTTKGEQGMGLGLSMCKATVERHGGTIGCTSKPGERTRFRIRLPVSARLDAGA
jgi:signal transduction histidine kinase